jgi:hypothetical protein
LRRARSPRDLDHHPRSTPPPRAPDLVAESVTSIQSPGTIPRRAELLAAPSRACPGCTPHAGGSDTEHVALLPPLELLLDGFGISSFLWR